MICPQIRGSLSPSGLDVFRNLGTLMSRQTINLHQLSLCPLLPSYPPRTREGVKREVVKRRGGIWNTSGIWGQPTCSATPPPPRQHTKPTPPAPANSLASDAYKGAGEFAPVVRGKPRWGLVDEVGLTKCRRCGRPVVFGEVVRTEGRCDDDAKWIKFDPDLSLHGCGPVADLQERVSQDGESEHLPARADQATEDEDSFGGGDDPPTVP